jgi:hypothetical protein
MKELQADIVIIGAGMGGCAAALAALQAGHRVILTEPTTWIGGQMTSQAVPPDEHPWIESFGCTKRYRSLRQAVRQQYRDTYPLTPQAAQNLRLNPGNGFVSTLCHEPKVSLGVLESWLRPFESAGQLVLLRQTVPVSAETQGDHLKAIVVQNLVDQSKTVLKATYFVDSSELGDVLPLAGAEYVTGAEAQSDTQEPHAAKVAAPHNMQAISWCFVLDYQPDRDNTIEKPRDYQFWRDYLPPLNPSWGGPLLSWQATHPITLEPVVRSFDPLFPKPERGPMDLWTFRRIADRANFKAGFYDSDIVLVNWPQIDYLLGNPIECSAEDTAKCLEGARQLSLSKLYWMQTEAPRADGQQGWKGLRLRPDITGTHDGLAMAPYIRESRRILGKFRVLEQHVGLEARMAETGLKESQVRAVQFKDSVGIGAYRIDLHPSTGMDNYIDVGSLPFQIPLGALIPQRLRNLVAGGKNLSVTHITNGCYRLHPVEWNVGEAAGELVAHCLEASQEPHQVWETPAALESYQKRLIANGFELEWPQITPL